MGQGFVVMVFEQTGWGINGKVAEQKNRCYQRSLELKAQRSKRMSSPTFSFFDGFFILPTVKKGNMLRRFTPTEDF